MKFFKHDCLHLCSKVKKKKGNITKNISSRDLKKHMNMYTITMYLHIIFHVNWFISLGDVKNSINAILAILPKLLKVGIENIHGHTHFTFLSKFNVYWPINKGS